MSAAFPCYARFRTGLSFQAVRDELANEQRLEALAGRYMFVTRATVLGRWCQHKRAMYAAARAEWRREQLRRLRGGSWRALRGQLARQLGTLQPGTRRQVAA